MADYMTLLGAENVSRAGHTISQAAETMRSAGGNIDCSLRQHERFLEDWLARFEQIIDRLIEESRKAGG